MLNLFNPLPLLQKPHPDLPEFELLNLPTSSLGILIDPEDISRHCKTLVSHTVGTSTHILQVVRTHLSDHSASLEQTI